MKTKFSLLVTIITFLFCGATRAQFVPTPDHVVVVVLENHAYSSIIGSSDAPYINSLANDTFGALFSNSHGVTHPSQPNYMYLFSGSSQNVILDFTPITALLPFTTTNLGSSLLQNNKTFVGYSEDLPSVGFTGDASGAYHRKHAPWINWQDGTTNGIPAALNQPFTSFPSNYNNLPTLSFVIPNQDHDMHDGTIAQADTWLQQNIDAYVQWAKANNSLLILTFDEDDGIIPGTGSNQIATIFVGQMVKRGQYNENIDHNNVLRTMEEMYGLPFAGNSSSAVAITDCWVYKPVSSMGATPLSLCPGGTTNLIDSSANFPTNRLWLFSGGFPSISTSANPVVTYNSAGVYDVTLITGNQMGYDTLKIQNYITVYANPILHLSADSIAICKGDTAIITASGASFYSWLPAPEIFYSAGNMIKANPVNSNIYKVIGLANGCLSDTFSVAVTVDTLQITAFNITPNSDTIVCPGSVISFTANGTNGGNAPTYQWKVNGNNVGANSANFSTYASGNGFAVNCIFTSSASCATPKTLNSGIVNVNISQLPHPTITSVDSALSTTSASGYQWLLNGQPISGATSQNYIAIASGIYQVQVFNTEGCSGLSNSVNVTITTTGLHDLVTEIPYTIYPNPNNGKFTVSLLNGEYHLTMFDVSGRLVYETIGNTKDGELVSIASPVLEKGVYLLSITQSGKKGNSKILVE